MWSGASGSFASSSSCRASSSSAAAVPSTWHPASISVEFEGVAQARVEDVLCVRVTPDGRLLAVALLDATVKVYYLDRWGGLAAATPGAP